MQKTRLWVTNICKVDGQFERKESHRQKPKMSLQKMRKKNMHKVARTMKNTVKTPKMLEVFSSDCRHQKYCTVLVSDLTGA